MTDSLILSLFKSKPYKPSYFNFKGAYVRSLFSTFKGLKNCVVIDSCASALVVWKSWEKLVFYMAQSLVAGLEAVLRPLHRLSHPFVLFHLSPLDIPQVSEYLMRWQKHLFPRIPQGKTLQGFKTRNIKIRDEDIHSSKVCPLLCRKLNSNAYWEAFTILPSTSEVWGSCHV